MRKEVKKSPWKKIQPPRKNYLRSIWRRKKSSPCLQTWEKYFSRIEKEVWDDSFEFLTPSDKIRAITTVEKISSNLSTWDTTGPRFFCYPLGFVRWRKSSRFSLSEWYLAVTAEFVKCWEAFEPQSAGKFFNSLWPIGDNVQPRHSCRCYVKALLKTYRQWPGLTKLGMDERTEEM